MQTKQATHTPGPWTFGTPEGRIHAIVDNEPWHRIICRTTGTGSAAIEQANARLIAAAPELLQALELAEATIQRLAPDGARATQGTRDVITAAIARARG